MSLLFASGSSDRVNHGKSASINDLPGSANGCTFLAWIYRTSNGSAQHIFTMDGPTFGTRAGLVVLINVDDDIRALVRATTDTDYFTAAGVIPINTWTFLGLTFKDSASPKVHIYAGSLVAAVAEVSYGATTDGSGAVVADNANDKWIGNLERALPNPFIGRVGRLAYLNTALALADLQRLQFAPTWMWAGASTGLLADYYGTGAQPDYSGNGNAGTVTSATAADHVPVGPAWGLEAAWSSIGDPIILGDVVSRLALAPAFHPGKGISKVTRFFKSDRWDYSIPSPSQQYNQPLTGTLTFAGEVAKQTARGLTAALSYVGAVAKRTSRASSGSVSFAGSLASSRLISAALTATLSFVGALSRRTAKIPTGTLTFSGGMAKLTGRAQPGALSFSGAMSRSVARGLAATLSFAGSVLASRLSFKALSGVLSFSGGFSAKTIFTKALAGVLSFVGAIGKQDVKAVGGTLSFSGAMSRRTAKTQAAVLSFSGALANLTKRAFAATLSFSGAFTASHLVLKAFTATLSFAGAMSKRTGKATSGSMSFSGAILRRVGKALSAVLAFLGQIASFGGTPPGFIAVVRPGDEYTDELTSSAFMPVLVSSALNAVLSASACTSVLSGSSYTTILSEA